jgi:hypothetical protein
VKPVAAIVESDIGRHAAAVDAAMREYRSTQEAFAVRRLALGRALVAARACWPMRGPKAKGWGDFLGARGIDQDVALEAMRYAGFVDDDPVSRDLPGNHPTRRQAGLDPDDDTGPRIIPAPRDGSTAPFRQLTKEDVAQAMARLAPDDRKWVLKSGSVNLQGNSGDVERGTWTTSKKWAEAIGPVDHDPFSNPRSLIASTTRCMLEDGGDGFGGGEPGATPGLYLLGERHGSRTGVATNETTTFFQWPYTAGFAERAIAHYGHTRFRALLRWSPDTAWFRMLWPLVSTIAIPQERIEFDPPPGVPRPEATISYPHALYYANWRDVTDEVRALCIVIPIDHATTDPRAIQPAIGL